MAQSSLNLPVRACSKSSSNVARGAVAYRCMLLLRRRSAVGEQPTLANACSAAQVPVHSGCGAIVTVLGSKSARTRDTSVVTIGDMIFETLPRRHTAICSSSASSCSRSSGSGSPLRAPPGRRRPRPLRSDARPVGWCLGCRAEARRLRRRRRPPRRVSCGCPRGRGWRTRSSARAARAATPTSRSSTSRRLLPTGSRSSFRRGCARRGGEAAAGPLSAPGAKVSLASATLEQLDGLPGIGPVTAQKILDWRQTHGPLRSADDLDAIPGIGPARVEQLRDLVTP